MSENAQKTAVIVQRGYQDTYEILGREFGPRGVTVFWDRRFGERRQRLIPVAVERRAVRRRRQEAKWNVLHFCVVQLSGVSDDAEVTGVTRR
ncbi:MAG: hypothetical protein HYS05_18155 [Acidobacteria bacterium]|nr:hypothetical protein [Acidobacteriota bacterium]